MGETHGKIKQRTIRTAARFNINYLKENLSYSIMTFIFKNQNLIFTHSLIDWAFEIINLSI